jgi:hypothetical protein
LREVGKENLEKSGRHLCSRFFRHKENDNKFCLTASISSSHEATKPDIGVV